MTAVTDDMRLRLPWRPCDRVGEHPEHLHDVAPFICDGLGWTDHAVAIREAKTAAREALRRGLAKARDVVQPATEDASGPAGPGEGGGAGAGEREAHRTAEGAMDAAIEAAARVLHADYDREYTIEPWDDPRSRDPFMDQAARIYAAMESHLRQAAVEQFTAALLTGLDDLERDDHWGTLVRPGDVADLVHRVAAEVGRGG